MQPLQNYIMTCHDSQHHFSVPIYSRMFFGLLLPVGNLPLKRSSKWSRSSLASSTLIRFSWNNSPFQNGRWTERKAAEALGAYLVKGNCTASQPVNSNVVIILYHVKLNQVVKCQPKVHKSKALLRLCLQRCHSIESRISFAIPLPSSIQLYQTNTTNTSATTISIGCVSIFMYAEFPLLKIHLAENFLDPHRWWPPCFFLLVVGVFCPETVLNTNWTFKDDWYPPTLFLMSQLGYSNKVSIFCVFVSLDYFAGSLFIKILKYFS